MIIKHVTCPATTGRSFVDSVQVGDTAFARLMMTAVMISRTEYVEGFETVETAKHRLLNPPEPVVELDVHVSHPIEGEWSIRTGSNDLLQIDRNTAVMFHPSAVEVELIIDEGPGPNLDDAVQAADRVLAKPI